MVDMFFWALWLLNIFVYLQEENEILMLNLWKEILITEESKIKLVNPQ